MTINDISFKNINQWLFMSFVVIAPIFFYTNASFGQQTMRIVQEQFFLIGTAVLFACIVGNVYISLFVFLSACLYPLFKFECHTYMMYILIGSILYYVTLKTIDENYILTIFKGLLCVALLNCVWMFMQYSDWDLIYILRRTRTYSTEYVSGLMGLKAATGMFLAFCVPLALRFKRWGIWVAFALFFPIYLMECSVAILGAIVAVLFHMWFRNRKLFKILLIVGLIGGSAYAYQDSKTGMFEDRFNLWKIVLRDAFKHPITGWGLDSFRGVSLGKNFMYVKQSGGLESAKAYLNDSNVFVTLNGFVKPGGRVDPWDNAHNEYIQLFYEFGMFGVLILIAMIRDMVKRFHSRNDTLLALTGFFIVLAIVSISQFPFHLARVGYLIPIMYALYIKVTDG